MNLIEFMSKTGDWVPFFSNILWITLILLFTFVKGSPIRLLLKRISDNISSGSAIDIGWIKLSELKRNLPDINDVEKITTQSSSDARNKERDSIYQRNRGIFISHIITPSREPGQKFDILIYLTGHNTPISIIDRADFFLGKSWESEIFRVKEKGGVIGIRVSAFGPFLCTCCVRFRDGQEISLYDYIDFPKS